MRRTINGVLGRIFRADAHPDYRVLRPLYCFVPDSFFPCGNYNESAFMDSEWPSINCAVNPHGIGSHIFPDITSSVPEEESTPELDEFLVNFRRYLF